IRFERRAPSTTFAPRSARSFAVLSPMPLLAPVITTTLLLIFDVSILFVSLFKNLLFTSDRAPLNDGLRDSEISSTSEVKKADTSVQVERLALCPAHIGTRSVRPAASAALARFLTGSRCRGYGKISVPFRFKFSITRLGIARASLPVNPFVKAVCPHVHLPCAIKPRTPV